MQLSTSGLKKRKHFRPKKTKTFSFLALMTIVASTIETLASF